MVVAHGQRTPMPHQQQALQWARGKDRLAFFHEMRLGKTLTTIWWLQKVSAAERILVVGPLSTLPSWQEELTAEGEVSTLLLGDSNQRLAAASETSRSKQRRWFLLNHEATIVRGAKTFGSDPKPRAIPSPVLQLPWNAVVLDESARIRNPKALQSRALCEACTNVRYKACLSGLPNPTSLLDFFQQMKFLFGSFMGCNNFWAFRDTYFAPDWSGYSWNPKRGVEDKIRRALRELCHFLSRKQVGLANKKVFETRTVHLPQKSREAYDRAEHDFAIEGYQQTNWTLVVRQWLSGICGGRPKHLPKTCHHNAKLNELLELLEGELKGEQVVVWFRHRAELVAVTKKVREAGLRVRCIYGDTPVMLRKMYRRKFVLHKLDVLCLQMQTGKYGIDLSTSNTAIYYSMTDDPEDFAQSMERIEHPKKKAILLYLVLLAADTIDEDRYKALREKNVDSKMFNSMVLHNVVRRLSEKYDPTSYGVSEEQVEKYIRDDFRAHLEDRS